MSDLFGLLLLVKAWTESAQWALPVTKEPVVLETNAAGIPEPDDNGCYQFLPERQAKRDVARYRDDYVLNADDKPPDALTSAQAPFLSSQVPNNVQEKLKSLPANSAYLFKDGDELVAHTLSASEDPHHWLNFGVVFTRQVEEGPNDDTVFQTSYDYDAAGKLIQVRRYQRRVISFRPEIQERIELNRILVYPAPHFKLTWMVIEPDTGGQYFYTPSGRFKRFEDESGCYVFRAKKEDAKTLK
jgi:YD repeat-containing protein